MFPHAPVSDVLDLQACLLAFVCGHVEKGRRHFVTTFACDRGRDLAIHQQVDAGTPLVRTTTDPQDDEPSLERERIAEQCAGLPVFVMHIVSGGGGVRVDDPSSLPAHVALVIRDIRDLDRPGSEGCSCDGPALVIRFLEVLKKDVLSLGPPAAAGNLRNIPRL